MLSKNNKQEQNRRLEEKNNRFSIRKLTVGAASVLIGAFFMGVSGTQTVHAADTTTVDVNSLKQAQAPKDNVNASFVANVDLGDDLGLGDLLNNYNKQFGDKNQTPANKEASTPSQATQPTTSSQDKKQDQQSDLDKATDKLVKDAVANLNKDPKADAPKVDVKKTNRTVARNVDVYEPGVDPNDDFLDWGYYTGTLNMDDMPQTRVTIDGKEYPTLWGSKSYDSMSLTDALKGSDWTPVGGGTQGTLPAEPGYTAKIARVKVDVLGGPDGIFTQEERDEAKKLTDQLNDDIAKNPYEIPAYTISSPLAVTFHVGYYKSTPVKVETRERVNVTLPTSTDPDEDYYYAAINTDANNMTGTKAEDGTYTWQPVEHAALDLNDALSKPDFVYAENGSWNNTLPSIPGYRAYISDVTANSASPEDEDNEAEVDALQDALYEKIHANPYEIPAYTTSTPINVYFYVEYEKVSDNGDAVTTPALPEYKGNVSGIPETRPADKPFEGGVAGMPLTQDALPAYTGDLSTNGDTEAIPVLPEAGHDDQNSDSDDEPIVKPEVTAADDTTAPVHSNEVAKDEDQVVAQAATTVAPKTEANVATADSEAKRAATLPQTGAKATVASVLGLMMVSVAAVLGLAVDKKRKN